MTERKDTELTVNEEIQNTDENKTISANQNKEENQKNEEIHDEDIVLSEAKPEEDEIISEAKGKKSEEHITKKCRTRTQEDPNDKKKQIQKAAESLLEGESPEKIDISLAQKVYYYLRSYKQKVVKIPDYYKAQRIDDVCSQLLLVNNSATYSNYQNSQIAEYENKLNQAKKELENVQKSKREFIKEHEIFKNESLQILYNKQKSEIESIEEEYSGDVPPKYRKYSREVLQIRKQEYFLQKTHQYIEAQKLHEEAEALEAYEYEQMKIQYINLGIENRERLQDQHKKQIQCLNEKMELRLSTEMPRFLVKEGHFIAEIEKLENTIKEEQKKAAEAQKATKTILETTNQKGGLPKLGNVVPQSPMTRVTTVNNSKRYTRGKLSMQRRSRSAYQ